MRPNLPHAAVNSLQSRSNLTSCLPADCEAAGHAPALTDWSVEALFGVRSRLFDSYASAPFSAVTQLNSSMNGPSSRRSSGRLPMAGIAWRPDERSPSTAAASHRTSPRRLQACRHNLPLVQDIACVVSRAASPLLRTETVLKTYAAYRRMAASASFLGTSGFRTPITRPPVAITRAAISSIKS